MNDILIHCTSFRSRSIHNFQSIVQISCIENILCRSLFYFCLAPSGLKIRLLFWFALAYLMFASLGNICHLFTQGNFNRKLHWGGVDTWRMICVSALPKPPHASEHAKNVPQISVDTQFFQPFSFFLVLRLPKALWLIVRWSSNLKLLYIIDDQFQKLVFGRLLLQFATIRVVLVYFCCLACYSRHEAYSERDIPSLQLAQIANRIIKILALSGQYFLHWNSIVSSWIAWVCKNPKNKYYLLDNSNYNPL